MRSTKGFFEISLYQIRDIRNKECAVGQTVNWRLHTLETKIRSRGIPCGLNWWTAWQHGRSFWTTTVSSRQLSFHHYSVFTLT